VIFIYVFAENKHKQQENIKKPLSAMLPAL
jgi:hypothetical protein